MKRIITIFLIIIMAGISLIYAETIYLNNANQAISLNIIEDNDDYTIIEFELNQYFKNSVQIQGKEYLGLGVKSEGIRLEKGNPELPVIGRSIMIPARSKMSVEIISQEYKEFQAKIIPSKGSLLRNQNPADIPYEFSDVYKTDRYFPENIVELGEPYILREIRGLSFRISPFIYNPVQEKVRFFTKITFKIYADGFDNTNVLQRNSEFITTDFKSIYSNQFLNFTQNQSRYQTIEEQGSILVISHPSFMNDMQDYVYWKNQKGIPTTMVSTNVAGTTHTAIKSYIQSYWASNPDLAFVQLVGDAAQIPTPTYAGGGSDPSFVMLVGNDHYPDMFIGRFSAETTAHVQTQVARTVHYERDIANATWLSKAMGVASNEGPGDNGEYDNQHMDIIRNLLLSYNYDFVDQFYQPSATATQVTNALNTGRGFVNYVGHGSNTNWTTTGFSNTHVNALTNSNMLPFIVSVACVNGNFTSITCFAEAWLRATHNTTGAPTGAIATYMSSINQPWRPPMRAQDVIAELLVSEEKHTIGGLFFNGSSAMLDVYPITDGYNTMRTWHIFGDASLMVRTINPQPMVINAPETLFLGLTQYSLNVNIEGALSALYNPQTNQLLGSAYSNQSGNVTITLNQPVDEVTEFLLTTTAFNKLTDIRTVSVLPNNSAYLVFNNVVNNLSGNASVNFNSQAELSVTLSNIGTLDTGSLSLSFSSDSDFINVITNSCTAENIPAESDFTIQTPFVIDVSQNTNGQSVAEFLINIVDSEQGSWSIPFTIDINTPILVEEDFVILDTNGNNNGYLDPSETAQIKITFKNQGNTASLPGNIVFASSNPMLTLSSVGTDLPVISPNQTYEYFINALVSENALIGSSVIISYFADFQSQVLSYAYTLNIGYEMEGFETGDFSAFNWQHSGNQNWVIDTNSVYEGNYSARSGGISHNQSSTLQISKSYSSAGEISFAYRVSSEASYDFLRFYINNIQQGQWSGNVNWTTATFAVPAGTVVFKWTYEKDGSLSSGSDCVWLDNISFSSTIDTPESPLIMLANDSFDFGDVQLNQAIDFELNIYNLGIANLIGSISLPECISYERNINFNISSMTNQSFNLSFNSQQAGIYQQNILINSNDSNNPEITVSVNAVVLAGNTEVQTISMIAGWNISSSYLEPVNKNLLSIFTPLINNNSLQKIQNESGSSIEYLSVIDTWINNIGDMNYAQGYRVSLNQAADLSIQGTPYEFPLFFNLSEGWNIISYPYSFSAPALEVLSGLIENSALVKVQAEDGASIEYLGGMLNDNIVNFEPGKGYAIRVSQDCILEFPAHVESVLVFSHDKAPADIENNYFKKVWSGNGWQHFNLYIVVDDDFLSLVQNGDEIGVFDGEYCVGAAVYTEGTELISVVASMNDYEYNDKDTSRNGYLSGNDFAVRIWSAYTEIEKNDFSIEILNGENKFMPGESSLVKLKNKELYDICLPFMTEITSVYPNPFNPFTNIQYSISKADFVKIAVFNIKGQKIRELFAGHQEQGHYSVAWEGLDQNNNAVSSGIYFTRLETSEKSIVRKIVLIK